jgi:hypothetical protein
VRGVFECGKERGLGTWQFVSSGLPFGLPEAPSSYGISVLSGILSTKTSFNTGAGCTSVCATLVQWSGSSEGRHSARFAVPKAF